jgi:hypothetical protein
MPWADDASGNQSKQYNPHLNLCTQNLNVPHEQLKHQYFVRFCSTSQHASSGEQFRPLIETWYDMFICTPTNTEMGHSGRDKYLSAYDCKLKQEILFRLFPHCLPSDNPQQAESSSGVGPGGNRNCIRGKVGGTKEEQETDDGYHALFSVSLGCITNMASIKIPCDQPDKEKRTARGTVDTIMNQLWLACRGVAQPVSDLQTDTGIKDKTAQFWIERALERSSNLVTARVTDSTTRDSRLNGRAPKEEKQAIREALKQQIQVETNDWLVTQPSNKWDQLPGESRASHVQINGIDSHPHHI